MIYIEMEFPGQLRSPPDTPRFFEFPTIESAASNGAKLIWRIRVLAQNAAGEAIAIEPDWLKPKATTPAGVIGVIEAESYRAASGEPRRGTRPTIVRSGKNLGKANATNPITQALRDALGRYNAQKKKSSTPTVEAPPPMLLRKHGGTRAATLGEKDFDQNGVFVQRKFNGVRVVAYQAGDEVVLYSRTLELYPGLEALRSEIKKILNKAPLEDHVHLDGEIYLHNKPLSWISGQTRREEDDDLLDYIVFDCFFPAAKAAGDDMPAGERQHYLDSLFSKQKAGLVHVKRAENFPVSSIAEIEALLTRFLAEGFEGAIARKARAGYQYSVNRYHSANLVKFKPFYDDEFKVVGFTQGRRGKDVGAVIWICEVVKDGVADEFAVVPKDMTYEERYEIFHCLGEVVDNCPEAIAAGAPARLTRFDRDFLGQPLTVEYPDKSSAGKPVQAKALTFRTYEDGLARDPLKRLYAECRKP